MLRVEGAESFIRVVRERRFDRLPRQSLTDAVDILRLIFNDENVFRHGFAIIINKVLSPECWVLSVRGGTRHSARCTCVSLAFAWKLSDTTPAPACDDLKASCRALLRVTSPPRSSASGNSKVSNDQGFVL